MSHNSLNLCHLGLLGILGLLRDVVLLPDDQIVGPAAGVRPAAAKGGGRLQGVYLGVLETAILEVDKNSS